MQLFAEGHSQAHNHHQLFQASVNVATGTFNFSYPLIHASGRLNPLHVNLIYRLDRKGMFGLPDGWALAVDYVDGKTAILDGKHWLIDPLWHDETGFGSGLKYFNQHGSAFFTEGEAKPVPGYKGLFYRYKAKHKDGSFKYFSHQGLLILSIDRFNNTVKYEYEEPVEKLELARLKKITDNYGNEYRFRYEPEAIIVDYPDGHTQTIYFNEEGVKEIVNPLRHLFKFTYIDKFGKTLLRTLDTPTGLVSELTYDGLPYLKGAVEKQMPVVIAFKQFDQADQKIHHEAHYLYAKGNNYTGFPNYRLSDDSDSLMDSGNDGFRYSVTVSETDGQTSDPLIQHKTYFYNYLHLPVVAETRFQDEPYTKTTYQYDISPFKYSRSTNYDKPVEVINWVWINARSAYIPSDKQTTKYDQFGNKIDETHQIYDRDKNKWRMIRSLSTTYYTDHFSLPAQSINTDETTKASLKRTYQLTTDNNNIADIEQYVRGDSASQWQPWQKTTDKFDTYGRKTASSIEWLKEGQPGIQKSSYSNSFDHDQATGLLVHKHISSLGNTHTTIMDTRNGQLIKSITPLGEVTEFTYDALNQPLSHIDPSGHKTQVSHQIFQQDGFNADSYQSPLGYRTRQVFDASHRQITHEDNYDGAWRTLNKRMYNAWGKVLSQTDIKGQVVNTTFDELMRPIKQMDKWGNETTWQYDDSSLSTLTFLNGKKIQAVSKQPWALTTIKQQYPVFDNDHDAQDQFLETKLVYSGFQKLLSSTNSKVHKTTGAINDTIETRYQYDPSRNPIKIRVKGYDGLEKTRETQFDLLGNKVEQTLSLIDGEKAYQHEGYRYTYDADNRLIEEHTPLIDGHTHYSAHHKYDGNNRLVETTLYDGQKVRYRYDAKGQLIKSQWYREQSPYEVSYEYDADGRRLSVADSDGQKLQYSYRLDGLLTGTHYPDKRYASQTYDAENRLIKQRHVNGIEQTFRYRANDHGELSELLSGQHHLHFFYGTDENQRKGQLLKRVMASPNAADIETSYVYGPFGYLASVTTEQTSALRYHVNYQYSPRGELTTQVSHLTLDGKLPFEVLIAYQYDALQRVRSEKHTDEHNTLLRKIHYDYDGNDNLLHEARLIHGKSTTIDYRYNALDQLVAMEHNGQADSQPLVYDLNGRLLQDSQGNRFTFDDNDFLLQVTTASGKIIRYDYYPDGLLSQRSSKAQHSDFYYDSHKQVLTAFKEGVWGNMISQQNHVVAIQTEQGLNALLRTNNSTGLVIKPRGISPVSYEAYGTRIGGDASSLVDEFGWNQEFTDEDARLTYLKNRFYSLITKRFISKDQWGVDNRYAFADANPVHWVDPTGHQSQVSTYSIGGALTVLNIVGFIFAIPTGGASLTFSAAASMTSAAAGALSALTMIGSQAALDAGNKAAAKALQATSLSTLGASLGAGIVSLAPKIAELTSNAARLFRSSSEAAVFEPAETTVPAELMPEPTTMIEETVGPPTQAMLSEQVTAAQATEGFAESVRDWQSSWDVTFKRPVAASNSGEIRYTQYPKPIRAGLKPGESLTLPRGLRELESAPMIGKSKAANRAIDDLKESLAELLGGDHGLAKQWVKKRRFAYGDIASISEHLPIEETLKPLGLRSFE